MAENSKFKQVRSVNDEEKAKRREDIIDAAESAFFNSHFDKVSMAKIAKNANLSRTLIYVYFKDKADLYLAILARATNNLKHRFLDAYQIEDIGSDQIKALGYAYYGFYRDKPEYFHMFSDARALLNQNSDEASEKEKKTLYLLTQVSKDCMGVMIQALQNGVQDGSICKQRASDPVKAAYFLRGMLHGVIHSASNDPAVFENQYNFDLEELITYSIGNASEALAARADTK